MPNPYAANPDVQDLFKGLARECAADLIARVLEQSGLTRTQFAKKVGLDPADVSRLLSGKRNVTVGTLASVLHAFDLRLEIKSEPIPFLLNPPITQSPPTPPESPDTDWWLEYNLAA